jgi:uridylate kinase
MTKPNFRRVIVKLSGEALSGTEKFGVDQPTIDRFAADLAAAHGLGIGDCRGRPRTPWACWLRS